MDRRRGIAMAKHSTPHQIKHSSGGTHSIAHRYISRSYLPGEESHGKVVLSIWGRKGDV